MTINVKLTCSSRKARLRLGSVDREVPRAVARLVSGMLSARLVSRPMTVQILEWFKDRLSISRTLVTRQLWDSIGVGSLCLTRLGQAISLSLRVAA